MRYILACFTDDQDIVGICADARIVLAYLPPYSLDLNRIEEAFAQLKQWIQKHYILAASCDSFEQFLRCGLENLKDKAKGHFTRCRIGRMIPRDDRNMNGDYDDDLN